MSSFNAIQTDASHQEHRSNDETPYIPYDFYCSGMGGSQPCNYHRKLCVYRQRKGGPCYGTGCQEGAMSMRLFGLEPVPSANICACGNPSVPKAVLYRRNLEKPTCSDCLKAFIKRQNGERKRGRRMKWNEQ